MPRQQQDDDESLVTISLSDDPHIKSRQQNTMSHPSAAQSDQLARAREVALNNRRVKVRAKMEARLAELRTKMGDLSNDQLDRVIRQLIETENHHRSKLASLTEKYTEELRTVNSQLRAIKALVERAPSKQVKPLSDVSSISTSIR